MMEKTMVSLLAGRVLARPSTSLAPRILILGGGFAGVSTAMELAKRCAGVLPVHLTLISEQNFFLFTPMLAEAATDAVENSPCSLSHSALVPCLGYRVRRDVSRINCHREAPGNRPPPPVSLPAAGSLR